MVRPTARETLPPCLFKLPFYRMKITERVPSAQHDMLIALDRGLNEVFYAAPLFHTVGELNNYYLGRTIALNSVFIRPRNIGRLDNQSHYIAFDARRYVVFSDPREVEGIRGDQFPRALVSRLAQERRPLGEGPLQDVLRYVETTIADQSLFDFADDLASHAPDDAFQALQRLADLSMRYFNAQLFVVQSSEGRDGLRRTARR